MPLNLTELLAQSPQDFINLAYRAFLGRDADPDGFQHFLEKLRKGYRRQSIILDIILSPEGQTFGEQVTIKEKLIFAQGGGELNSTPKKRAIAVLTHCRYSYLAAVLSSILKQTIHGVPLLSLYTVYVFQDGVNETSDQAAKEGHKAISLLLEALPSEVRVIRQHQNVGVALQYDTAERLFFEEIGFELGIFFEDDMITAPGYMQAMDLMADKFQSDLRVGMFSACPANMTQPISIQHQNRDSFLEMGHSWGFGISQAFWKLRQPFVEKYLSLLGGAPYEHRPHQLIYDWLNLAGFKPAASSQDYVKQCGTIAVGGCRLSTFVNFGMPIGRNGLHFTPEKFEALEFDRVVVFDDDLNYVSDLLASQYKQLMSGEQYAKLPNPYGLREPENFSVELWLQRLSAGDFDANKVEQSASETRHIVIAQGSREVVQIPSLPHMNVLDAEKLRSRLSDSLIYLEYGAGGSTLLAFECGVKQIHSVESDRAYLEALAVKASLLGLKHILRSHYASIGPTKEWGYPIDERSSKYWSKYCLEVWYQFKADCVAPDLVLIDGRFRVACFLSCLCFADVGTVILFDDYRNRPHYHVVEKFLEPCFLGIEMAEFIKTEELPLKPDLLMLLNEAILDPR